MPAGATDTLINLAVLAIVGYDPAQALRQVPVIPASGIESMYLFEVLRLKAPGQDRLLFPVLGHTLPPDSPTEGVLGLDFLHGHILTVAFQQGTITLV